MSGLQSTQYKFHIFSTSRSGKINVDADSNEVVDSVMIRGTDVWGDVLLTIDTGFEDIDVVISNKGNHTMEMLHIMASHGG